MSSQIHSAERHHHRHCLPMSDLSQILPGANATDVLLPGLVLIQLLNSK
jgi:hypothetical protein